MYFGLKGVSVTLADKGRTFLTTHSVVYLHLIGENINTLMKASSRLRNFIYGTVYQYE